MCDVEREKNITTTFTQREAEDLVTILRHASSMRVKLKQALGLEKVSATVVSDCDPLHAIIGYRNPEAERAIFVRQEIGHA